MMTTFLIGCIVAALLILVGRLLLTSRPGADPLQAWITHGQKINIGAFLLLVDPSEAIFLWKSLPPLNFRRLQRKRIALALQSVRRMAGNAELLTKVATLARRSGDSEIASAADQLMLLSFRVRMNAFIAEGCLFLRWIFPAWHMRVPIALERYEQLLQNCDRILAHPARIPAPSPMAG
jgi:hypothetical protein